MSEWVVPQSAIDAAMAAMDKSKRQQGREEGFYNFLTYRSRGGGLYLVKAFDDGSVQHVRFYSDLEAAIRAAAMLSQCEFTTSVQDLMFEHSQSGD